MTAFIQTGLTKLTGNIRRYRCRREAASFVLTSDDQSKMGIVAIAAGLAGLGGQAVSVASNASSFEEDADYVEFQLDGKSVMGWVWRSPFKEGDFVEVAAADRGDHYELYGIARPADRIVALYPHCSRGRGRHMKNAVKWWILLGLATPSIMLCTFSYLVAGPEILHDTGFYVTPGITAAFFALMFASLARKWMPFVSVAEKVFRALGWPNPSNVDLVKSSKEKRLESDPGEFGTFFHRY